MIAGILLLGLSDRNSGLFTSASDSVMLVRLVGQAKLLQRDRDLHAVRRRKGIELDHVRIGGGQRLVI
jgi:hypothetical protein